MTHEYVVYIDEAGDDGLGKLKEASGSGQSRWFVVGACCVRKKDDSQLVRWRDEILCSIGKQTKGDLHFKNLKHHQRRQACRILNSKPIRIAVTMSNKITLMNLPEDRLKTYKKKNHLHNYITRWLLERVSVALKSRSILHGMTNCRAKVVFSRRGGMNYEEFRDYMRLIKDGKEVLYSPGKMDWDVIDPDRIDALDHKRRAGLQIADVVTSAMFHAVEPGPYGFTEPAYAEELSNRVLRHYQTGKVYNVGVTHMPRLTPDAPLTDEQRAFFDRWKL